MQDKGQKENTSVPVFYLQKNSFIDSCSENEMCINKL